ncbi:hypothetical protein TCAL_14335 [Tigriopus californicus]|uniref:Saposin B-type domain-containing protein n=1 Tax=Tigriopus californicus TaxID=6832 RepID=A0A553NC10_TIGCA|nr:uncharacterized protein LOC131889062 [Tigriopus californicus]TRY62958.1 hypothetical protein TCAL_14335 [Tigriopus californicus]
MEALSILFVTFLAFSSALANPTCEECVLILAELQVGMTSYDHEITKHLHDNFCANEQLNNQECRLVAGHYPDMLDIIMETRFDPLRVCEFEGLCNKNAYKRVMLDQEDRNVNCNQCDRFMRVIRRHLTDSQDMDSYEVLLKSHAYCGRPEPPFLGCVEIVDKYFREMHLETMEWFFHPHEFCVSLGICEDNFHTSTMAPTNTTLAPGNFTTSAPGNFTTSAPGNITTVAPGNMTLS